MTFQPQSRLLKHYLLKVPGLGNYYAAQKFLHTTAKKQWTLRDILGLSSSPVSGMAHRWDRQLWRPTMFTGDQPRTKSIPMILKFETRTLLITWCTWRLSLQCYNPKTWLNRAFHLFSLGYPDLAAGDAHKAHLLVMAKLDSMEESDPEWIKLSGLKMRSLTQLAKSLLATRDHVGLREVCSEGLAVDPSHSELGQLSKVAAEMSKWKLEQARSAKSSRERKKLFITQGVILNEHYPFMTTRHMSRDKNDIDTVKKRLEKISSNCSLASRNFSNPHQSKSEGFGVYATADIRPNTRLFDDETILGTTGTDTSSPFASKGPEICENCCGCLPINSTSRVKSTCCSTVYCSEHCRETASRFYHSATCGRDFKWLFEGLQGVSKHDPARLRLRVLSICTQSDCHPLDHPLIARLISRSWASQPSRWTLRHNIVNPNMILQQLGVDIFQDLRFDTWVLQNVESRLINNSHIHRTNSRRYVLAVNYLLSFLNHSCEPNAEWNVTQISGGATAHDSTTLSVIATKPIKKGQEICVDYNTVSRIPEKANRQKKLTTWFPGGVCECTRCLREK